MFAGLFGKEKFKQLWLITERNFGLLNGRKKKLICFVHDQQDQRKIPLSAHSSSIPMDRSPVSHTAVNPFPGLVHTAHKKDFSLKRGLRILLEKRRRTMAEPYPSPNCSDLSMDLLIRIVLTRRVTEGSRLPFCQRGARHA
jgi:hypothetical protein